MSRRYAARTHKMAHRFASRVRATHAGWRPVRWTRRECLHTPLASLHPSRGLITPLTRSRSHHPAVPAQERLIPVSLGGHGIFEVKPGVSKALVEWEVLGHRAMHEQAHKDQTEASLCLDIVRRHRRRPWPQAPAPPPPLSQPTSPITSSPSLIFFPSLILLPSHLPTASHLPSSPHLLTALLPSPPCQARKPQFYEDKFIARPGVIASLAVLSTIFDVDAMSDRCAAVHPPTLAHAPPPLFSTTDACAF